MFRSILLPPGEISTEGHPPEDLRKGCPIPALFRGIPYRVPEAIETVESMVAAVATEITPARKGNTFMIKKQIYTWISDVVFHIE